ncbi:hypothetical protein A0H81_13278 [Grifola frondosa]|uniref:DUF6533 domain-containing protein n=1 Tax=Grifola frondosa TaxID=5627 RepID=A0A1C7LSD7_GRIFR|nr:hypothetical protein A0H81_13278 [Grifola frondosa]
MAEYQLKYRPNNNFRCQAIGCELVYHDVQQRIMEDCIGPCESTQVEDYAADVVGDISYSKIGRDEIGTSLNLHIEVKTNEPQIDVYVFPQLPFIPLIAEIIPPDVASRYFSLIALTLLYYDFVLTIPMEVERYWTGSCSWASFLYFVNRYLSILSVIPVIFEFFGDMSETCHSINSDASRARNNRLKMLISNALRLDLLILRTYALYNHSRKILYLLISTLGFGGLVSIWAMIMTRTQEGPPNRVMAITGCDPAVSTKQGYYLAAAWCPILVFDGTVFVLTFCKALQVGKTWSGSLFTIMLRDGTIYFGIITICYLSNILTYVFADLMYKGVSDTLTTAISSVLATRLMLNIRDPEIFELPRRWESESADILAQQGEWQCNRSNGSHV